ncbi:hypothetical protein QAD02_023730 [Eretmocerus hayati]|uniref:Uncharacterized protein n=1 Tax=Eretmocerus hayati TaxID=131215 RepID=A0ACC2PX08_9HYME|nr:hypothetical protein QAD02_023730 [Eretmocerus hayati]
MAGHRSRRSAHRDHDEPREDRRSRSRERRSRRRRRRDSSRSRDRSHDRYHQNRHRRSGSRHTLSPQVTRAENGESDLAKLAQILSGMASTGSRSANFLNEKTLPESDPDVKNVSASDWIGRVEECGSTYKWDERTQVYLETLKLRGNAKLWCDGLQKNFSEWNESSESLIRQFPDGENFGKLMEEVVNYRSPSENNLRTHCFTKLGKINPLKLNLSEDKIVDMIATGRDDESTRTIILAARVKTLADLNERLRVFMCR